MQSFALSIYSFERLLETISKATEKTDSLTDTIPFLRAYKIKGAKGVDKVWNNLKLFF